MWKWVSFEKLKSDLNQTWFTDNMGTFMIISSPCISVRQRLFCFGTKRKLHSVQDFSVKCSGKTINNSFSVKYLGVNLDNALSGESIASNVIKKTSSRLKFLYRHSNCLNFKSCKTLSSALIMCHFDYACSSWYSAISQKYKKQLQILQI